MGAALLLHANPFDFPLQFDAGILLDALSNRFAKTFNIGGRCIAAIDQEIAVKFGNLRATNFQTAAAGGIDQLPRFLARWIFERRAAGTALDRLCRLTRTR